MRDIRRIAATAASLVLALGAGGMVQAQDYDHHYRHGHHYSRRDAYYRCRANQRHSANTGTVLGAVVGGLGGNALSHGRVGGTLVGAGVGAVAGHEIARNGHRC
jgi:hypothetical protein